MSAETPETGNPPTGPAQSLLDEGMWERDGQFGYHRSLTDDDGNIREQGVYRSPTGSSWWLITETESRSKETSHETLTGALNAAERQ